MTKESIQEWRRICKRYKDVLGAPYPWIIRVEECLDEIERLQEEIKKLKKEKGAVG